jgi:hypothetical protein
MEFAERTTYLNGGSHDFFGEWYGEATTRVLLTDSDNTVWGVADASGVIKERLSYNTTGLARTMTGAGLSSTVRRNSAFAPYGWQGQFAEPITGRLWNGAMDYDALHGRHLTGDPGYHPDIDRTMSQFNAVTLGVIMAPIALHASLAAGVWAAGAAGGEGLLATAAGVSAETVTGGAIGYAADELAPGAGMVMGLTALAPGITKSLAWGAAKTMQGIRLGNAVASETAHSAFIRSIDGLNPNGYLHKGVKAINYNFRQRLTGTQILKNPMDLYTFKNSKYFKQGDSFEPNQLWMTPELMNAERAVQRLALPYPTGYDTMLRVTIPAGTKIMNPRRVWPLFGRPGGGVEVMANLKITEDMYEVIPLRSQFLKAMGE